MELERLDDHICVGRISQEPDGYRILLADRADENRPLLQMSVSDDLFVKSIRPMGVFASTYPYHSESFYDMLWEPLVCAIGHYSHNGVVLCPNLLSKAGRFMAFGPKTGETTASIQKGKTWLVKTAQAAPAPSPPNAIAEKSMVVCTNAGLPAYHGRTGVVTKVTQHVDYQDVAVNFGRGLDDVVLTNKDVRPAGLA